MSEKLVISVDASSTDPDLMKVQDVFSHVLELFNLVAKSESDPDNSVVWRLVSVSMNSPLTVTAEAVSARHGVNVDAIARAQKIEFADNIRSLRRGVIARAWSSEGSRKIVRDVLSRNRNGIGKTDIDIKIDDIAQTKVEISHDDAVLAIESLAQISADGLASSTKTQVGSVEGYIIDVSKHYNRPGFKVKERKTGEEIWCVINDNFRSEIVDEANFDDVWSERRVVVSGLITYNKDRKINRIEVSHIRRVEGGIVSTTDLIDNDFTGGLSAAEYLEKFREGTLD